MNAPVSTSPCLHRFRLVRRCLPGLLALGLLLTAAPAAWAQLPKIFVASTGLDTNSGARNAPMRSFTAAQSAVAAGGEIVVLDTAGYGPFTITKALSVTVPPGVSGFVTVTDGTDGITIAAGATDAVVLRGLIVEGVGTQGEFGIVANSVGSLSVQDCSVSNFYIGVLQSTSGSSKLKVNGGLISNTIYGVVNEPQSGSPVLSAVITNCQIEGAGTGGLAGESDAGTAILTASHCTFTNCGTGLLTDFGCTIYAYGCTISDNTVGISSESTVSFGLNAFSDNGTNGTFSSTPGTQ